MSDSLECIFTTVTQNERTKRFLFGIKCSDSNDLANVLPIEFRLGSGGTVRRVHLESDEMLRSGKKDIFSSQVDGGCPFCELFPRRLINKHEIDWRCAGISRLKLR